MRDVFELLYLEHTKLSGIPLVMLKPRFPFAADAVQDLIDSPRDELAWGTFYRLLSCYGLLARDRREEDLLRKERRVDELREWDGAANDSP